MEPCRRLAHSSRAQQVRTRLRLACPSLCCLLSATCLPVSGLALNSCWSVGSSLLLFAGGTGPSANVDIFDLQSNTFTQATLSKARNTLAATGVGTKAMFAGNVPFFGFFFRSLLEVFAQIFYISIQFRLHCSVPGGLSGLTFLATVDIFDAAAVPPAPAWTTASLSLNRCDFLFASLVYLLVCV